MQKILLLLALTITATTARSQSILDLTEQLALDVQKLATIKSTLRGMVQGYDRLKTGYTHIRDVVKNNFNLHKSVLDALWILSPAVRADPRLPALFKATTQLITNWQSTSQLGNNPLFTTQERVYIVSTLDALLRRCAETAEELTAITTDHELRMSDGERLAALDRLSADVSADTAFLRQFNATLAIETARRQHEANDLSTLKALYGLPD